MADLEVRDCVVPQVHRQIRRLEALMLRTLVRTWLTRKDVLKHGVA